MKKMSYERLLRLICLLCLTFVLCFDLLFSDLPELFSGADKLMNLTYNVALSLIAAFLFYYISVYKPNKRKTAQLQEVAAPLLKTVIFGILSLLHNLTNKKLKQHDIWTKELTEDDFNEYLDDVFPDNLLKSSADGTTVATSVLGSMSRIQSECDELLRYAIYLEPINLKEIADLRNLSFFESWQNFTKGFGQIQTINNVEGQFYTVRRDISFYSSSAFDLHKRFNELVKLLLNEYKETETAKDLNDLLERIKNEQNKT